MVINVILIEKHKQIKIISTGLNHDYRFPHYFNYISRLIAEQNLKWYTNGVDTKMFTEGLQPTGWIPGRNTFVTSIDRVCPICGSIFKARGLGKHVKYCGQKIP